MEIWNRGKKPLLTVVGKLRWLKFSWNGFWKIRKLESLEIENYCLSWKEPCEVWKFFMICKGLAQDLSLKSKSTSSSWRVILKLEKCHWSSKVKPNLEKMLQNFSTTIDLFGFGPKSSAPTFKPHSFQCHFELLIRNFSTCHFFQLSFPTTCNPTT